MHPLKYEYSETSIYVSLFVMKITAKIFYVDDKKLDIINANLAYESEERQIKILKSYT